MPFVSVERDPIKHRAAADELRKDPVVAQLTKLVTDGGPWGEPIVFCALLNIDRGFYEAAMEVFALGYIAMKNEPIPCCAGSLMAAIVCLLDPKQNDDLDRLLAEDALALQKRAEAESN